MSMSGRDGGRSDDHMRAIVQRFATNVLAHHRRDQFSSDLEAWRDLATESEELLEVTAPPPFAAALPRPLLTVLPLCS